MTENTNGVPVLPCPNCGANLLEKGFYNFCSESVSLREDNYAYASNGRFYVDHDENNHETVDHECELTAFCRTCKKELPWALYELRDLDGCKVDEVPNAIAELQKQLENRTGA